jgi:hypothetical protein
MKKKIEYLYTQNIKKKKLYHVLFFLFFGNTPAFLSEIKDQKMGNFRKFETLNIFGGANLFYY